MLIEDSKNYHAWAHRQWILEEFNLWEGELEFIDHMLLNDLRNNSAWNQRHFVLSKTKDLHSLDLIKEEIQYISSYSLPPPPKIGSCTYMITYLDMRSSISRKHQTTKVHGAI